MDFASQLLSDWGGLHLEMILGTSNVLPASSELSLVL